MAARATTVTMRGLAAECADCRAPRNGKNGLCDPAQWLMWDASSAASVETKSMDEKSGRADGGSARLNGVGMVWALPQKLHVPKPGRMPACLSKLFSMLRRPLRTAHQNALELT